MVLGLRKNRCVIDSLFSNIRIINDAIKSKKGIEFEYLSYAIIDERVDVAGKDKRVLPHRLVFNDGKYYLIGYDEEEAKNNYYRVDLISKPVLSNGKIKISYYNERMLDGMEIAREIEKHPLMLAERDYPIKFKVIESALDRVIDAFGKNAHGFEVLDETRFVGDYPERIIKFQVTTTKDEAYRWSLANADVAELVLPQDVRDRLARVSKPIYQLYTYTLPDKVRENLDYVLKNGKFRIYHAVDADTAYATYKALSDMNKLDVVKEMLILGDEDFGNIDYLGDFINTEYLTIHADQLYTIPWASRLVNVTDVDLTDSQIVDVSWMKEMNKLRYALLSNSSVTDLSVLSKHTNIDRVSISGTKVSDISFIENFKHLTQLEIALCPIDDYSPLFKTKSHLKILQINRRALEEIGEENIKNRHIGIDIRDTNDSPFWYLSY
ncbi:MAG: WYL domain-containing protein [Ruminococcaceae bacterium]|nr:WYL domain-containing protein [Oscillospiraceae bacterium]